MTARLPKAANEILERGTLCYLAAPSRLGPHVTPVVFVLHGGRVWLTTSRSAVKSRAWRRDPRAGGLIADGRRAVAFRGRVTLYDAFDPLTWPAIAFRAPSVGLAWTRFSMKNARFFAGYARDAYRVPFAWTPPGRVLASVDLDAGAVLDLDGESVVERWGIEMRQVPSRRTFRERRGGSRPERSAPEGVRSVLGPRGGGVVGLASDDGPIVLPAAWARSDGTFYAAVTEPVAALANARAEARGALVVDHASTWRASKMRGLLFRGDLEVFAPDGVERGREALAARLGKVPNAPRDAVLLRLRPDVAVWWNGWSSGTVGRT